jgi:hypothetical protein
MNYIQLISMLRAYINDIEDKSLVDESFAEEYKLLRNELIPLVHKLSKMQYEREKDK